MFVQSFGLVVCVFDNCVLNVITNFVQCVTKQRRVYL